MGLQPEHAGHGGWINTRLLPPIGFIATAMKLTMVSATERDRELVADPCVRVLAIGQSAGDAHRGTPTAHEAGLTTPGPSSSTSEQDRTLPSVSPRRLLMSSANGTASCSTPRDPMAHRRGS